MKNYNSYLDWLSKETSTKWWHDSAIPNEIDEAIENGALGVTTNPVLTYKTLQSAPEFWKEEVDKIPHDLEPEARAEALLKIVASYAANKFLSIYEKTNGMHGYALGQVNPLNCGNSKLMLEQALRFTSWGENIAVKLPTTNAALPVIEELASRGIAVCTTLNFSVSQAISAAESYEKGIAKAKSKGIKVKPCFVVQQGGRLEEYLMECVADSNLEITKEEIMNAGNAVTQKSYDIYKERGYSALIMPAGLRGIHHLTHLAGGNMVFSLQTRVQKLINDANPMRCEHINETIDDNIIEKLRLSSEFLRAYDVDGLKPKDFITFGITQKTLSQFYWTGWAPLETYGTKTKFDRWF
jgi:transaldolase